MRVIQVHSVNSKVTIYANGDKLPMNSLAPMDMLAAAIAKDIMQDIQNKEVYLELEKKEFSVTVTLQKNSIKEKSKIIDVHIELPESTSTEVKSKILKIADRSHLKRLLGNEILFESAKI